MTFKIERPYGVYTCVLQIGEYNNGHIAIEVDDLEEGLLEYLTVNLPNTAIPKNYAFIDINNCIEAGALIEQLGIGRNTGKFGFNGYCNYPLYEMFPEKIREYCLDDEDEPITVYKMFRTKNGKLYPLFVEANRELPLGEILTANVGQIGKDPAHVKSRIGDLSLRPGFHSTTIPFSDWIGKRAEDGTLLQRRDTVWAECEVYGQEQIVSARNGLRTLPDGWYRFRTNSKQVEPWIISDNIRINRILSDEEVSAICAAHGLIAQRKEA